MKKDVGMTTAQKSKETRRMESLFCISSQQYLHIRTLLHYNLKLPDVYVGIVGWIYRTKIPSFLFPYFFEQWSSLHLFSFHEMLFPLLVLNWTKRLNNLCPHDSIFICVNSHLHLTTTKKYLLIETSNRKINNCSLLPRDIYDKG